MNRYFILVCFTLVCMLCQAQEEPYYEPVGKRKLEDMKYLPNLETLQRRIYLGVGGGSRFSSSVVDPSMSLFRSENNTLLYWDAQLGYNFNDKWYVELAYAQNPLFIDTELLSDNLANSGLRISNGENFNEFQIRTKRKILQVDKVPQKAGIFLTSGISFNPSLANRNLGTNRYLGSISNGRNAPPDTIFYSVETFTNKHAFALELGLELSGRLTEQLGIGVFVKSWWRPKGSVFNELNYRINSTETNSFTQQLNTFNFNAGVLIYFNMINWVKYRNSSG